MRVWCQLCELSFEEPLELEVHYLSLSHHIKLEANNPVVHSCSPCGITGLSLGEYSKHVDTENHRKKRERIRAIIDTMDAGEGPRVHFNFSRDRSQHMSATPNYLEPTSSFVRSGFQRSTYPVPKTGDPTRPHHTRSRRPNQQSCGEAFEGSSSYQQNFEPFQTNSNPPRNGDEWTRNILHSFIPSAHLSHDRFPAQFESDGRSNYAEQVDSRCAKEDREVGTSEDDVPPQKRGLLARLSLRRRGKAAKTSSSEKPTREKDKKTKRKKSQSSSPASPSLKTKVGESESPSRRRAALLNVALEDKTKKWELVAVKGKASYLKNRSQRMFKDRMNKYRLVDSKGMVVEDIHEEEATSSRNSRATNGGKREANLPHFTSHIWGTGPEAIPLSQRSDFHSEAHRVSKLPSIPAPRAPLNSYSSSSQEESSSGYATLNVLPMSTPKNFDAALRAYENYDDRKLRVLDRASDSKAPVFDVASTNTDTVSTVPEMDSFCSRSFTSSLVVESHSLTSRLNLTNANADQCTDVVTVKEETVDSPPPDALPSPPQFEQTIQLRNSTTEGRMAGDKERDEFWALGIAEHKKGHEILDMRAKVEKLQKELIEATSCLQKLEVEMNEILRRKSELLGLAASHNAT